jgi:LmbE family N-acetylglucosaminyl deacetylase
MADHGGSSLRLLIIGAHPDDADIKAGGLAALYARHGHVVKMVSLTNGDAGHHEMGGAALAWRRRSEAEAAGRRLGAQYVTLDNHDAELLPTLELRRQVVALIRAFRPDLVTSPRPWDYHPDHRAAAQVVLDAIYLSTVPNFCTEVPHLPQMPVVAYVYDGFQRPYPFQPDVAVDIDAVIELKIDALHCHVSQVYEWLPYNRRELDAVPEGEPGRRAWLRERYAARFQALTERYRSVLVARYGPELGHAVRYAEFFEGAEYGTPLTEGTVTKLFPF